MKSLHKIRVPIFCLFLLLLQAAPFLSSGSRFMYILYKPKKHYIYADNTGTNLGHTDKHTCIRTYMRAYTHTYINACIHIYMHACIHTCIHACIRAYIHTYKYIDKHKTHAYKHTRVYVYTHIHTNIVTISKTQRVKGEMRSPLNYCVTTNSTLNSFVTTQIILQ